ncbi:hypothetical protein [Amycolatopsis eburnea]|uniref:Uncharacterized protein n=1 Tax=Amycolatopsis eburnea TaxID=2267691 RepID=A0A427TPZ1_9PSEU|nr:hypothetical protein [Amycolatopsis eburnea]RSD26428.1 hypothetical protein EIY87_00130 [Amycolatopsis eburnea]
METAEAAEATPSSIRQPIITSAALVLLSGALASVYIGGFLVHAQPPMTPVIAYAGGTTLHLAALAGLSILRAGSRPPGSLRATLLLGAVFVGVYAALGFHRMHPASPAFGALFGGFFAALGPLWVGLLLPREARTPAEQDMG